MKKCPFCAEEIQDEAIKCKHCGEMFTQESPVKKIKEDSGCLVQIISFFIPGVGQFMEGNITAGVLFLGSAIVFSAFTFGLGWVVAGIISASMCSDIYKCSKCRSIIDADSAVCRYCGAKFNKNFNNAIESNLKKPDPVFNEDELMAEHNISFSDGVYHFRQFQYDKLKDAVVYAQICDQKEKKSA